MKLETAQSFSSDAATPDDIRFAVRNDLQRGEFLILSRDEHCFVQAAGDSEPFHVEYYEKEHKLANQCKSAISADELEQMLLKYLAGDAEWAGGHDWQLEEDRPWWRFW